MNITRQHPPSPNAIITLNWLKTIPDFLAVNGFSTKISDEWKRMALERFGAVIVDGPEQRFVGVYYGYSKVHCTDGQYSQTLSSFFSYGFALVSQVQNRYGSILGDEESPNRSHILIQDRRLNTWTLWGFIPGIAFLKTQNEALESSEPNN